MEKLDFDPCTLALKNTSEIYHSATLKKDAFMCRLTTDLTKSFEKQEHLYGKPFGHCFSAPSSVQKNR